MMYAYSDEPERGYMDDESIVSHCAPSQCGDVRGCTGFIDDMGDHLWPVYSCSLCERDIEPDDPTAPLCGSCALTAKATAEAFPEGPERFNERRTRR